MIAHVAAAAEASGRVLLWLDPDVAVSRRALEAAVLVASAYSADVETVVMDGPSMADLRDIPSAYLSIAGKSKCRSLVVPGAVIDFREQLAERQRREVDRLANKASVAIAHVSAPGDAIDRLSEMCLDRGPWNMVVLGRAPGPELSSLVSAILANVSGATGVVVAGRRDCVASDEVAVIVEDVDRMPSMLRAAQRLAIGSGRIHVMIAAETAADYREIDHHLRLVTANDTRFVLVPGEATYGVAGVYDESIFRLRPSFTITRFAGALPGQTRALMRLVSLSAGPMLLVR